MEELNNFLKDIESQLTKDITLSLNYQDIAKNLYPFLIQEYKKSPQYLVEKHIADLKKTLPKN